MGVDHAAGQIASDEVWAAVGLADLEEAFARLSLGGFEFGCELPPKHLADVLGRIVPEAVDAAVVGPPGRTVRHGFSHFGAFQVQGGHEGVKPCRQPVFVPAFGVERAVGQVELCGPIGMDTHQGVVFVNVVPHVIEKDVHSLRMRRVGQGVHRRLTSIAAIDLRAADRPVAMVAAEAALNVGARAVLPQPPGTFGVLGDWRNPHRVHPQGVPIPVFQGVEHAFQVPTKVIGHGQDGRVVDRLVVLVVSIGEAVHHQEIHGGAMPVGPRQLRCISHRGVAFHGNQKVLCDAAIPGCPSTNMVAPRRHGWEFQRNGRGICVRRVVHEQVVHRHHDVGRTVGMHMDLAVFHRGTQTWGLGGIHTHH